MPADCIFLRPPMRGCSGSFSLGHSLYEALLMGSEHCHLLAPRLPVLLDPGRSWKVALEANVWKLKPQVWSYYQEALELSKDKRVGFDSCWEWCIMCLHCLWPHWGGWFCVMLPHHHDRDQKEHPGIFPHAPYLHLSMLLHNAWRGLWWETQREFPWHCGIP